MAAPGLVESKHGQRLAADPAVLSRCSALAPRRAAWRRALRCPAVLRYRESPDPSPRRFQGQEDLDLCVTVPNRRLLPAGCDARCDDFGRCIAGTPAGRHRWRSRRHRSVRQHDFHDAAKYVVETNQPAIFIILEVSQKWYDLLPKDLQQIVDRDGLSELLAINAPASRCTRSSARPGRIAA